MVYIPSLLNNIYRVTCRIMENRVISVIPKRTRNSNNFLKDSIILYSSSFCESNYFLTNQ